mgnify:CR=1 FL=1
MNENIIILKIAFEEKAKSIFFDLFEEFREKSFSIDRNSRESAYQNMQSGYSMRLKMELEELAMNFLDKERALQDELNNLLAGSIRFYLHQFLMRSRSL